MIYGSLFTGIGGIDLGLDRAGMTCAWQVENNKYCNQVLRRHWPDVERQGNIKNVSRLRTVDLICGGFPCQDVSVAGKRAGLAGERSGLFFEFIRIIKDVTPVWVLIENVPGLLSSNGGRDMGAVLGALAECGYGWAYRVLDAQFYGVPQRRRRVFIVGCLGDSISATKVLFESESSPWDTPPCREEGQRVTDPITRSFAKDGRASAGKDSQPRNMITAYALSAHSGRNAPDSDSFVLEQTKNPTAFQQNTRDEVRYIGGDGKIAGALSSQAGMKQQNYLLSEERQGLRTKQGDEIHSSLTANPRGGPQIDPVLSRNIVRRLMPIECERLQGFPDNFTALGVDECGNRVEISDSQRYKMLGNAVCGS